MAPDVRYRIVSTPRAKTLANWRPPDASLREVRRKYGGPGVSDDDLLLRYFAGEEEVAAMRAAGPRNDTVDAVPPMLRLFEALSKQSACNHITVQKGAQSVMLRRGADW